MTLTQGLQRTLRGVVLAACLAGAGAAMAQPEPTMAQIYATAQAGQLEQAQVMVQQVLVAHPNSAKAFFVQAELYARQGNLERARAALAQAERIAPGLPFAKVEAVQALRSQLAAHAAAVARSQAAAPNYAPAAAEHGSSMASWGLPVLLLGGVLVVGYLVFRRNPPVQPVAAGGGYGGSVGGGLSGPQQFGQPAPAGYGPAGYGPGGVPVQDSLGSRIMGGVATGLAVGAGVMAAEAIGRKFMGSGEHDRSSIGSSGSYADNSYQPIIDSNADMGGQNFGIADASWDDGGSAGGGSDWDN